MAVCEPICSFWNLYVGFIYATLFLCFVGYPIAFQEHRGRPPGIAELGYCGIGTGVVLAVLGEPIFIRRIIASHPRDPCTGQVTPEASIIAVYLGAILSPMSEFWFSWTAVARTTTAQSTVRPRTRTGSIRSWPASPSAWAIPSSSSIGPLPGGELPHLRRLGGGGQRDGSVRLYILAAALPLAGHRLYESLGIAWTGTLLGLVEVVLIPIPFVFYQYGWWVRRRSGLSRELAGA